MKRPFPGNNTAVSSLVGIAILVGVLVGFSLSTIGYGVKFQFLSQSLPALNTLSEEVVWYHEPSLHSSPGPLSVAEVELQYLNDIIAKTNGFYARDYSLWLGWNNVRGSCDPCLCVLTIQARCAISSKQQSSMAGY